MRAGAWVWVYMCVGKFDAHADSLAVFGEARLCWYGRHGFEGIVHFFQRHLWARGTS